MPTFVDENGKAAEPPIGIDPIDPAQGFARVQALVIADLHLVGMSGRRIAKLFNIPETSARRLIACVPDEIANRGRDARYLRRLREVVDEDPIDFHDLMNRMLSKAGTAPAKVGEILAGLGNRRRSLETAVGLKQRRKPEHAEAVD